MESSDTVENMRDYAGDIRLSGVGVAHQNYLLQQQWPECLNDIAERLGFNYKVPGLNCAALVTWILLSYLGPDRRDPALAHERDASLIQELEAGNPVLKWAWMNHPSLTGDDILSEAQAEEQRMFVEDVLRTRWRDAGPDYDNSDGRNIATFREIMEGHRAFRTLWNRQEFCLFLQHHLKKPLESRDQPWDFLIVDLTEDHQAELAERSCVRFTRSQPLRDCIRDWFKVEVRDVDPPLQKLMLCGWPLCLRVVYRPEAPNADGFNELRSIMVDAGEAVRDGDRLRVARSEPRQYNLVAVVRHLSDRGDADSVRVYSLEGRHILKPMASDVRPYPYAERLDWKLGDLGAEYYKYYIRTDVEVVGSLAEDRSMGDARGLVKQIARSIHASELASMLGTTGNV